MFFKISDIYVRIFFISVSVKLKYIHCFEEKLDHYFILHPILQEATRRQMNVIMIVSTTGKNFSCLDSIVLHLHWNY